MEELGLPENPTVLVADDDELIRRTLSDILGAQGYRVLQAENGTEAIRLVGEENPDVVLLDVHMPGIDGIEVLRRLKAERSSRFIPVVMVTGERDSQTRVEALRLGADDFLTKPPHVAELTARVRSLVKVKAYHDYQMHYRGILESEVRERTRELAEAHNRLRSASLDTIYRLSRAAEYKDEDTSVHLQRMSHYAAAIARRAGSSDDRVEALLYAAPMHDIGKIGIPDRILLKPGKLDPEEWEIMKRHTFIGAQILEGSESEFITLGRSIALTHHERWDGTGYPEGLSCDAIPIEGRIAAVADVFDAVTSKRPYKEAFSNEKAFEIISEGRGKHFDPELIDRFFEITDEIVGIQRQFHDGGTSVLIALGGG